MNLALVCPHYTGHLNSLFTLGRALQRRGHRVTQVGVPPTRRAAEAAGLAFLPIGEPEYDSDLLPAMERRLGRLRGLAAFLYNTRVFDRHAAVQLRDLPRVLARGFDAVLADQVVCAAPVCEALGLPCAVACTGLPLHLDPAVAPFSTTWGPARGWLGRLRNRLVNWLLEVGTGLFAWRAREFTRIHKLPPWSLAGHFSAGLVQVGQQPAWLDFPRDRLPDHFHYTGPWHEPGRDGDVPFPWERLDGRPVVYASLGTLNNTTPTLFDAMAQACQGLPVQLVLSLGGEGAAAPRGPLPEGAIVVPYAPQLEVLRRATAVFTHGGLNTVLEALAVGLPMVVIPLANDQPGNARRLAELGVAEMVVPGAATPARLREALRKILTRPEYRAAAQRYQAELRRGPGVAEAACLVEWALEQRQRLTRTQARALGFARA